MGHPRNPWFGCPHGFGCHLYDGAFAIAHGSGARGRASAQSRGALPRCGGRGRDAGPADRAGPRAERGAIVGRGLATGCALHLGTVQRAVAVSVRWCSLTHSPTGRASPSTAQVKMMSASRLRDMVERVLADDEPAEPLFSSERSLARWLAAVPRRARRLTAAFQAGHWRPARSATRPIACRCCPPACCGCRKWPPCSARPPAPCASTARSACWAGCGCTAAPTAASRPACSSAGCSCQVRGCGRPGRRRHARTRRVPGAAPAGHVVALHQVPGRAAHERRAARGGGGSVPRGRGRVRGERAARRGREPGAAVAAHGLDRRPLLAAAVEPAEQPAQGARPRARAPSHGPTALGCGQARWASSETETDGSWEAEWGGNRELPDIANRKSFAFAIDTYCTRFLQVLPWLVSEAAVLELHARFPGTFPVPVPPVSLFPGASVRGRLLHARVHSLPTLPRSGQRRRRRRERQVGERAARGRGAQRRRGPRRGRPCGRKARPDPGQAHRQGHRRVPHALRRRRVLPAGRHQILAADAAHLPRRAVPVQRRADVHAAVEPLRRGAARRRRGSGCRRGGGRVQVHHCGRVVPYGTRPLSPRS
jgi:hypothetical protein